MCVRRRAGLLRGRSVPGFALDDEASWQKWNNEGYSIFAMRLAGRTVRDSQETDRAVSHPTSTQEIGFFITRFSMKNSIIRWPFTPLCPASGPTCTSKLFPAFCSALISCIELFGWTLLSAVP
jgi:hypothetical protein